MSRNSLPSNVEFLFTELKTGLTFANMAISAPADKTERIERDRKNARKAYDTLLKFQSRVLFSEAEEVKFAAGLEDLETALRKLGESI
ncbi:MAG TPA: hypothetical protein VJA94_17595 [Candidatus Angelobacter sp.]